MDNSIEGRYRAVYLTGEDLRLAASVIYNAYLNDPFFLDTLFDGDRNQYEQKLRAAIREELHELWLQEQPLVGLFEQHRLIGVLCVAAHQDVLGDSRYWHWRLKMILGAGWHGTRQWLHKESTLVAQLPGSHCGIIQFVCITPQEQGKGLSHLLLQAVTHWCDEQPSMDGLAVWVNQDTHLHWFNQHGFVHLGALASGNTEGQLLFYAGPKLAD